VPKRLRVDVPLKIEGAGEPDQQKCPHWIILRRKGKMFVSSPG
jgi:hypothetical protein